MSTQDIDPYRESLESQRHVIRRLQEISGDLRATSKLNCMFHRFRHPKLNGFLLGLLQGVPQGLSFPDQKQYVGLGFDNEMVIPLACFGFFGPPVFVAMSHFMNRGKYLQWWSKVMEYVNLYHMLFWGCLSLASLAYFSLRGEGASEGYAVCAFFAAGGIGFLIAGRVDAWLQRQRVRNAI